MFWLLAIKLETSPLFRSRVLKSDLSLQLGNGELCTLKRFPNKEKILQNLDLKTPQLYLDKVYNQLNFLHYTAKSKILDLVQDSKTRKKTIRKIS